MINCQLEIKYIQVVSVYIGTYLDTKKLEFKFLMYNGADILLKTTNSNFVVVVNEFNNLPCS